MTGRGRVIGTEVRFGCSLVIRFESAGLSFSSREMLRFVVYTLVSDPRRACRKLVGPVVSVRGMLWC